MRVSLPFFSTLFPNVSSVRLRVCVVLFTQGINEKQSLANATDAESTLIQGKINAASIRGLEQYAKQANLPAVKPLLDSLKQTLNQQSSSAKNVDLLIVADDAVRALKGGRAISCKSGKDRTAMAMTFEQARWAKLSSSDGAANLFREFGVRIRIAEKNIGKAVYSFNKLQRSFLPEDYRPPVSTIQDMMASWTKSDAS